MSTKVFMLKVFDVQQLLARRFDGAYYRVGYR